MVRACMDQQHRPQRYGSVGQWRGRGHGSLERYAPGYRFKKNAIARAKEQSSNPCRKLFPGVADRGPSPQKDSGLTIAKPLSAPT